MYLPGEFAESRPATLHAAMRAHPFATLVTHGPDGIVVDHLPLHLTVAEDGRCCLQGHVARANPVWRDAAGTDVLAVFHGPQAYVTPSWYPTKRVHGRAVPTWNYVAVHARGRLTTVQDPAQLRVLLDALVEQHERHLPEPWRVTDAPAAYVDALVGAIVGLEIEVAQLVGKWKVSQNQPAENRAGVVAGLRARGGADDLALAAIIAAQGESDG